MKKEKLGKTLVETDVLMKTTKRSLLCLKRSMQGMETEESLLAKANKEFPFCYWQSATSSGRIKEEVLQNIPQFYPSTAINVKIKSLKYFNREVSELMSFILDRREAGDKDVKK